MTLGRRRFPAQAFRLVLHPWHRSRRSGRGPARRTVTAVTAHGWAFVLERPRMLPDVLELRWQGTGPGQLRDQAAAEARATICAARSDWSARMPSATADGTGDHGRDPLRGPSFTPLLSGRAIAGALDGPDRGEGGLPMLRVLSPPSPSWAAAVQRGGAPGGGDPAPSSLERHLPAILKRQRMV